MTASWCVTARSTRSTAAAPATGWLADQFDQVDADCERLERRQITSLDQVQDQEENGTENPAKDDDAG